MYFKNKNNLVLILLYPFLALSSCLILMCLFNLSAFANLFGHLSHFNLLLQLTLWTSSTCRFNSRCIQTRTILNFKVTGCLCMCVFEPKILLTAGPIWFFFTMQLPIGPWKIYNKRNQRKKYLPPIFFFLYKIRIENSGELTSPTPPQVPLETSKSVADRYSKDYHFSAVTIAFKQT